MNHSLTNRVDAANHARIASYRADAAYITFNTLDAVIGAVPAELLLKKPDRLDGGSADWILRSTSRRRLLCNRA